MPKGGARPAQRHALVPQEKQTNRQEDEPAKNHEKVWVGGPAKPELEGMVKVNAKVYKSRSHDVYYGVSRDATCVTCSPLSRVAGLGVTESANQVRAGINYSSSPPPFVNFLQADRRGAVL